MPRWSGTRRSGPYGCACPRRAPNASRATRPSTARALSSPPPTAAAPRERNDLRLKPTCMDPPSRERLVKDGLPGIALATRRDRRAQHRRQPERELRQVLARAGVGVRERDRRLRAVHAAAVADEQVLRLVAAQRAGRERAAAADARRRARRRAGRRPLVPIASATTSARCSGHHSASSCQRGTLSTGDTSNGLPGTAAGSRRCGTPSRAATAAQSRLWRSSSWITPAGGPSACARSIASGTSTGSISQTPSPVSSACAVRVSVSSGNQEKPNGSSS